MDIFNESNVNKINIRQESGIGLLVTLYKIWLWKKRSMHRVMVIRKKTIKYEGYVQTRGRVLNRYILPSPQEKLKFLNLFFLASCLQKRKKEPLLFDPLLSWKTKIVMFKWSIFLTLKIESLLWNLLHFIFHTVDRKNCRCKGKMYKYSLQCNINFSTNILIR